MNYHKITKHDIANGTGVRVVLWVSGCSLKCYNCHNPQTHDFNSGIPFTEETMHELIEALGKLYIAGLTISGGNPIERQNIPTIYRIVGTVKEKLPNKTIWIYTGLTYEEIYNEHILLENLEANGISAFGVASMCDVLVDGRYVDSLRDITLPFAGSTNQRLIDVQATLKSTKPDIPILYCN